MKKDYIDFFRKNKYYYNPKTMQVEITNRCPLKCKQCYKPSNGGSDIDLNLVKDLFKDAFHCGIKYIMLNGGEPLVYPHFIEILELAKQYQFEVACVTSGYSLAEDYLRSIKNTGCYLQLDISLNGSTEKIHNLSRDGYGYAIQAINIMNKSQTPYGINWVSRKDNINDFPKLVEFAKANHAVGITVITTKLDGFGELQSKLSTDDYIFLSDYIKKVDDDFITVQHCFPYLNRLLSKFNRNRQNKCPSGLSSFCIDVEGYCRPCIHLLNKEKYTTIHEYWTQSPSLNTIRTATNTACSNCVDCSENKVCKTCFCMDKENILNLTSGDSECPIKSILNKESCSYVL